METDGRKKTANPKDAPDDATEIIPPAPSEPTVIMQSPPTVLIDGEALKLKQKPVEEQLGIAKKLLASEDFSEALQALDVLLQSHPNLDAAKALKEQIQQATSKHTQSIFDQGIGFYVDSDWENAISTWRKILSVVPNDSGAKEWIHKAEIKREQERIVRAGLLRELEKCGKLLSERNFVVAEEHLDLLKNRFTGEYRLVDLQKIYEALVVRTRVALEKEFEELRSNVISAPVPVPTKKELQSTESLLLKQFLAVFESGKKHFEKGDWQKALSQWEKAREINPADPNLIHWIALAESHLAQSPPRLKTTPVRSTIAFLSVFVVTALLSYFGYQKYQNYVKATKNHELIGRAVDYYRAGRLEESWKLLQIYLLQDPENETVRQLLDRVTFEMRVRETTETKRKQIASLMQNAEQQKSFSHYEEAMKVYQNVLKIDPLNVEAQQNYNDLKNLTASKETVDKVKLLLSEAESLYKNRKPGADEKTNQVLYLDPHNNVARELKGRIEEDRLRSNRIQIQLELASYLMDRGQNAASQMILNRILSTDPGQAQARQLLAKAQSKPAIPRVSVEIRVQPAARLFIDGRDAGSADYFNQMETIGNHILHFERPGYRSSDHSIDVKNNVKNAFSFQLKRE